jgi:hypothetical protein
MAMQGTAGLSIDLMRVEEFLCLEVTKPEANGK